MSSTPKALVYDALQRRFGPEPEGDYERACWHFQKARALRAEAARFEGDREPFEWIEPESDFLCRLAEIDRSLGRFYRALHQDKLPPRWLCGRLALSERVGSSAAKGTDNAASSESRGSGAIPATRSESVSRRPANSHSESA